MRECGRSSMSDEELVESDSTFVLDGNAPPLPLDALSSGLLLSRV